MKRILIAFMGICFLFCPTLAVAWNIGMLASAEVGKPYTLFVTFGAPGPPEIDIDWGDGTTTGWIPTHCDGPPIGVPPTCYLPVEHTWAQTRAYPPYHIKAKGRNNLVETDWSDSLLAVVVLPDSPLPSIIDMPISGKAGKQFSLWFMAPLCNGTETECHTDPLDPECHTCNRTLHIAGMTTEGEFFIRERLPAPPHTILNVSSTYEFNEGTSDFDLFEIFPEAMFSPGIFEVVLRTEMKSTPAVSLIVTGVEGNYRFAVPAIRKK